MGSLIAHCPKTEVAIDTGIDTEYESLSKLWSKSILVRCPHCDEDHVVKVRDAYVRGQVSDFGIRGNVAVR